MEIKRECGKRLSGQADPINDPINDPIKDPIQWEENTGGQKCKILSIVHLQN